MALHFGEALEGSVALTAVGEAQMVRKIHRFENGVEVFDDQLIEVQRARYKIRNVHEVDEEDLFISLVTSLPKGATYVSVGAAIGYYPLLAKKVRCDLEIHCFEPLPRHLEYLRENINLNKFSCEDFHIYPIAISAQSGKANLVDQSYGSSLDVGTDTRRTNFEFSVRELKNVAKRLLEKKTPGSYVTVVTSSLSEVFQTIGRERIDLLQMDVQGHEEAILRAYLAGEDLAGGQIMQFLVGTHGSEIHAKCRTYLEQAEFRILHDEYDTKHQPDGILVGSRWPEGKQPMSNTG